MSNFRIDVQISAASQPEANIKMKALMTLAKKLTARELERLANVVANEPLKVKMAKKFLGL